jgi:hypothetical protein
MSSAHQQLSQLTDGVSLPAYMIYLLLCDTIFWVLAAWFCIYVFFNALCFLVFHILVFALFFSGILLSFYI